MRNSWTHEKGRAVMQHGAHKSLAGQQITEVLSREGSQKYLYFREYNKAKNLVTRDHKNYIEPIPPFRVINRGPELKLFC